MTQTYLAFFLAALLGTVTGASSAAEQAKGDRTVQPGSTVSVEYTLTGEDGKVIETSKGKPPITYVHGRSQMIPGFERELSGMKVGGEKHFKVKPEDAYGPVNKSGFQEVPKDKIPADGLKVGAMLAARSPEGRVVPMRVHEIKEKTVVMDLNHPMAGKTLTFDVKVLDIQTTPPPAPKAPAEAAKPATPAQPNGAK